MRIATLNAWGLPKPFADDVSTRIREIGRRLAGLELDAIAFQEVWTDRSQERLLGAGAAAGLVHAWHAPSGLRGSGLLALSRFPIEGVRFEPYDLRGVPSLGDFYGGKGFAELRLATPSGPLTLVDTHLLARYTNDAPHEYRAQRVGQIVELASGLVEVHTPLLVAGDFNLDRTHEEYAVLLGLTGAHDSAAEFDPHVPTVYRGNPYRARSSKPDRRVDYLLARPGTGAGLRVRSVERCFDDLFRHHDRDIAYSNHAGLLIDAEIVPGAGSALPAADPSAVATAARLLGEGRALARSYRRDGRIGAGAGLGAALVATVGMRTAPVTRRRLLRGSLNAAGFAALAPVLGFSFVSEVVAPDELRAFDEAAVRLARLGARSLTQDGR
jgi:endonuclease/exonuclease/phosphatase family metal-dependent hydrolase